jgi:citrate lyase beta subunit
MNAHLFYPVLYSPATTNVERLAHLVNGGDAKVRRIVVCTEDSVSEGDLPEALTNLKSFLPLIKPNTDVAIFIRVRNPDVMKQVLEMPDIDRVAGMVIPKASPDDYPLYADPIADYGPSFRVMPILESARMVDRGFRTALLTTLTDERYRPNIDVLRIGGNDLMGQQGIRRDDHEFTIYDTVVGKLIGDIVNEFRGGGGFIVTAPVFECYGIRYDVLFQREVRQHVLNNLFGQTVIHPRHLRMLWDMYRVRTTDFESAQQIVAGATAVHGHEERMDEMATHFKWAQIILARAELFGQC